MKNPLAFLSFLLISTLANAQSANNTIIEFVCPGTNNDPNIVTNYGTYISGDALEFVNGMSTFPFQPTFKGPIISQSNIPSNLANGSYVNSGTSYSPATGVTVCQYESTTGFDQFSIGYQMTNGLGGVILSSTMNQIAISVKTGFAA